jgi:hypothetical protein
LRQQQARKVKLNQPGIGDTIIRACGKAAAHERIDFGMPVEWRALTYCARLTSRGPGNNMAADFAARQSMLRCGMDRLMRTASRVEYEKWVMEIAEGSGPSSAFVVCGSRP